MFTPDGQRFLISGVYSSARNVPLILVTTGTQN